MTDPRHPLYRLAMKAERESIPIATISGGLHRLDLTTDEYLQLRKLIPRGLPGSGQELVVAGMPDAPMLGIVERLRFDAIRCEIQLLKGVARNIDEGANEIEWLRKERDRLYDHVRHLVTIIVGLNKNEQVCDAAAYLTQITPPLSR